VPHRRCITDLVECALEAIRSGFSTLESSPFTCRKAGDSPFLRELIVLFGRSGHVGLFEIESPTEVPIVAVRHQREDDCH
jgi:hypothetical protein